MPTRVQRPLPAESSADPLLLAPARGPDPQTCVVLAHGGGNDRLYGFWPLIDQLTSAGLSVLTDHLPGHGAGGTDRFSLESTRTRLDGMIGLARAQRAVRRVVLLGQSLGGAFSADLLLRGIPLDGLILVSAPLSLRHRLRPLGELAAVFSPATMRVLRYVSLVEALPAVGPFNRTRYPVRVVPGTSYLDAFRDALDRLDLERRVPGLGAIPCPVLIAHGRRDGIVPFDQAVRLERAFGAQAELFGEETGRHLDLLLRPRTLARIGDWIRAVES